MHDLIFSNIQATAVPQLKDGAGKLGLDRAAFEQCLDSSKHQAVVKAAFESGEKLGVNSTPTLFINGKQIEPLPQSPAEMDAAIAQALKTGGR